MKYLNPHGIFVSLNVNFLFRENILKSEVSNRIFLRMIDSVSLNFSLIV